jgi:hypothetical protein
MRQRMGDKVVQYYGLSREAVLVLKSLFEIEWELAGMDAEKKMEVTQLVCFVFLGYAQVLRGEEI